MQAPEIKDEETKTTPEVAPEKKVEPVPAIQPKAKKRSVDLKLLQRLMEDRTTFQTLKKVYRLGFSLICGVMFHYLHFAQDYTRLNLATFACVLISFYYLLETAEKFFYTNKINVSTCFSLFVNSVHHLQAMLRQGNETVAEKEKQFGIADMFGGAEDENAKRANQFFGLIDQFTSSGLVGTVMTGQFYLVSNNLESVTPCRLVLCQQLHPRCCGLHGGCASDGPDPAVCVHHPEQHRPKREQGRALTIKLTT